MEKLLLLVVIRFCSGFADAQQTRHIVTSGSGRGHWYQSTGIRITGSNQLVFQAKGYRDAVLGLATDDSDDAIYWTIVIGEAGTRKDSMRYKSGAQFKQCHRSWNPTDFSWFSFMSPGSLSSSEYRTFWSSWDHHSIRLGRGDIVGENQYCEMTSPEEYSPTYFYLRLGSYKTNTIDWIIHFKPPLTQHIQTSGSGNGDWFQSTGIRITGSNQLMFGAKGSRDAVLGLATENKKKLLKFLQGVSAVNDLYCSDDTIYWTIVIGGGSNQKVFLRYNYRTIQTCYHNSLSPTEYKTFWLSWDQRSVKLGRGDSVGENQYCETTSPDENLPTDFYLRLGSYKRNTIDWIIRAQDTTDTSDASDTSCGLRTLDSARIVGGSASVPHSWPWQVSLRNSHGHHHCGGSLIGNNYIVTAAHCKHIRAGQSVYIGTNNRTMCEEPCKCVTVTRVWRHGDYDDDPFSPPDNDIAIVRFSPSVTFSAAISPICLPEADYSPYDSNTECYATVSGRLRWLFGRGSEKLQEVQLPIVPQSQCGNLLGSRFVEHTMVCAGNVTDGGIDTCHGDSGGPLACHTVGENHWKLFGITSWGVKCAEPRKPGVYTKVTNYLHWIENTIN